MTTRITVASVNHELTMTTMVAGRALAFVASFGHRTTLTLVLARERVASVTLGEYFVADLSFAHKT